LISEKFAWLEKDVERFKKFTARIQRSELPLYCAMSHFHCS
jgi:hypothetical protein